MPYLTPATLEECLSEGYQPDNPIASRVTVLLILAMPPALCDIGYFTLSKCRQSSASESDGTGEMILGIMSRSWLAHVIQIGGGCRCR